MRPYKNCIYCEEVTNLDDAINLLSISTFDIIFESEEIEKNNNLTLLKKCNNMHLNSCVILVGKDINFEKMRQAVVFGAFDYILGTDNLNDLFETLARCIEHIINNENAKKLEFIKNSFRLTVLNSDTKAFEDLLGMLFEYMIKNKKQESTIAGPFILELTKYLFDNAIEKYPWLKKFVETYKSFEEKLLFYTDLQSMLFLFEKYIREIIASIKLLYPVSKTKTIYNICDYILENSDKKMTLSKVADNCFLNKTYLSHAFKVDMGISFVKYISIVKMLRAKNLLKKTML